MIAEIQRNVLKRKTEEFIAVLSRRFDHQKCPDDGNCLYHAIPKAVNNPPAVRPEVQMANMMIVRKALSDYMTAKRRVLAGKAQHEGGFAGSNIDVEIARAAAKAVDRDGWGDKRHVALLAAALKRPIVIHSHMNVDGDGRAVPEIIDRDLDGALLRGEPIHILFVGGNHWERLVPKVEQDDAKEPMPVLRQLLFPYQAMRVSASRARVSAPRRWY